MDNQRALIIGGGIGGLAAAVALHQIGWQVQVYEQATVIREVGAGITLWANALHALDQLGLAEDIRALHPALSAGGIYTWRGKPLIESSFDGLARQVGTISIAVHRAELLDVLRDAAGAAMVQLNKHCIAVDQDADGVQAHFSDGSVAHGDLLIGADGIRSVVRQQLIGDGEPIYAGYTAWRAITPLDQPITAAGEYWGCGARFGIVPLDAGRVYWFATHTTPAAQHSSAAYNQALLLNLFRGWSAPIESLIRATPADVILRHDVADRSPLRRWSFGRVTLLGDAAHPMTPNLGQGACQALEDAVVLAKTLRGTSAVEAALHSYEQQRIPRTSAIVQRSRRIGQLGQWTSPLVCAIRNVILRVSAPLQPRQMQHIIGYRP